MIRRTKSGVRPGKEPVKHVLSFHERLSKLSEIKKSKPKHSSPLVSNVLHSAPYTMKRPYSINIALTKSPLTSLQPLLTPTTSSSQVYGLIDKFTKLTTQQ